MCLSDELFSAFVYFFIVILCTCNVVVIPVTDFFISNSFPFSYIPVMKNAFFCQYCGLVCQFPDPKTWQTFCDDLLK